MSRTLFGRSVLLDWLALTENAQKSVRMVSQKCTLYRRSARRGPITQKCYSLPSGWSHSSSRSSEEIRKMKIGLDKMNWRVDKTVEKMMTVNEALQQLRRTILEEVQLILQKEVLRNPTETLPLKNRQSAGYGNGITDWGATTRIRTEKSK